MRRSSLAILAATAAVLFCRTGLRFRSGGRDQGLPQHRQRRGAHEVRRLFRRRLLVHLVGRARRPRGIAPRLLFPARAPGVRTFVAKFAPNLALQTFLVALLIQLVVIVLTLPLSYYEGFVREHAYNLSTQTVSAWASDFAIASGVSAIAFSVLFTVIYVLIRRLPQNWWVVSALVFGVFIAVISVLGPIAFEPLLNKFKPMEEGRSKPRSFRSLAPTASRPRMSTSSTLPPIDPHHCHVSGMFGTTRVSLGDNLIARGSPAEVRAVMGHELGHYVLNHSWFLIAWQTIGALITFAVIAWIYGGILANGASGVTGPGDPAGHLALHCRGDRARLPGDAAHQHADAHDRDAGGLFRPQRGARARRLRQGRARPFDLPQARADAPRGVRPSSTTLRATTASTAR